jgi:hypothetical protein
MAEAIRQWWHNDGRLLVTSAMELTELRLVDLTAPDSFGFDIGYSGEGGTATGEALPNNVAAVVKWGTGLVGPSNRGRTYVGGISSDSFLQNRLTDSAQGALATHYNALLTAVSDHTASLAIVSLCHDKVWRTTGVVNAITSLTAEKILRTQQRRLPGE